VSQGQETTRDPAELPAVLRHYSPRIVRYFGRWLDRYFKKHFDGVRISLEGCPPEDRSGALIVYTNHPSWWDPILFLLIARHAFPGRRMFGPMDAAALAKYSFFERIGAFGIDPFTRRGAAKFLATSRAILTTRDASLWITAQGEFSDPRSRPVQLRTGVAHLIRNLEWGWVVPLAVEYPFWNERAPEALARFGTPFELADEPDRSTDEWNLSLAARLTETMDALAEESVSRDPGRFRTLVLGRAGVGGLYDRWRKVKAWSRGRAFDPAHGEDER